MKRFKSFRHFKKGELFVFYNKTYSPAKMFNGIYLGNNMFFVLKHFKDENFNNIFEDWNKREKYHFITKL